MIKPRITFHVAVFAVSLVICLLIAALWMQQHDIHSETVSAVQESAPKQGDDRDIDVANHTAAPNAQSRQTPLPEQLASANNRFQASASTKKNSKSNSSAAPVEADADAGSAKASSGAQRSPSPAPRGGSASSTDETFDKAVAIYAARAAAANPEPPSQELPVELPPGQTPMVPPLPAAHVPLIATMKQTISPKDSQNLRNQPKGFVIEKQGIRGVQSTNITPQPGGIEAVDLSGGKNQLTDERVSQLVQRRNTSTQAQATAAPAIAFPEGFGPTPPPPTPDLRNQRRILPPAPTPTRPPLQTNAYGEMTTPVEENLPLPSPASMAFPPPVSARVAPRRNATGYPQGQPLATDLPIGQSGSAARPSPNLAARLGDSVSPAGFGATPALPGFAQANPNGPLAAATAASADQAAPDQQLPVSGSQPADNMGISTPMPAAAAAAQSSLTPQSNAVGEPSPTPSISTGLEGTPGAAGTPNKWGLPPAPTLPPHAVRPEKPTPTPEGQAADALPKPTSLEQVAKEANETKEAKGAKEPLASPSSSPAAPSQLPPELAKRLGKGETFSASVGSQSLSPEDVERHAKAKVLLRGRSFDKLTEDERRMLEARTAADWAEKTAIAEEAKRQGVTASDQEVREFMQKLKKSSDTSLEKVLKKAGFNEEQSLEEARRSLLCEKLIDKVIEKSFPENKIRAVYDANPERFVPSRRLRVQEIRRARPEKPEQAEQIEQQMKQVQQEATKGGDFSALVTKYSDSPTRQKGGDTSWIDDKSEISEEEASALVELRPGQVSRVISTPEGFKVVKILEIQEPKTGYEVSRDRVVSHIRQYLRVAAYETAKKHMEVRLGDDVLSGEGKSQGKAKTKVLTETPSPSEPALQSNSTGAWATPAPAAQKQSMPEGFSDKPIDPRATPAATPEATKSSFWSGWRKR